VQANIKGSSQILTSTSNMEILPEKPQGQTYNYEFYVLSFMNDQACTVKINGSEPIYLRAGQGFNFESKNYYDNVSITSFVIVEVGINFNWVGLHY